MRFLLVLASVLAYSALKITQLWPAEPYLAASLVIPLFGLMLAALLLARSKPEAFETLWFRTLAWAGSMTMALWATFVLISIPVDILHLVARASGHDFFLRDSYLLVFSLAVALVVLGFGTVARGPLIKEIPVTIENLPAGLQGLRIAQISDLHIGPTIRKSYVEKVVGKTNASRPDIIVLTGDIADAHPSSILEHLQPLADLKARYGVYYVTGNHEYYWGINDLLKHLGALGIKALLNENVRFSVGEAKILVAGVTDPMGAQIHAEHRPNTTRALASSEHSDFKILLAHRPDACVEAEKLGFNLQFSGHTHAGQFFPFSLLIGLAHRYTRGLYQHGRMWLYVNPGTGYWGPADRLGVSSEITLAVLA